MKFYKRKLQKSVNFADKEQQFLYFQRFMSMWKHAAIIWLVIDYSIVILSFGASIAVVFIQTFNGNGVNTQIFTLICSVLAAALTVVGFAVNPKRHMQAYREAFFVLNPAILKYQIDPTDENLDEIIKCIQIGEQYINSSYDIQGINFPLSER